MSYNLNGARARIMKICPALAAKLLNANARNRSVKPSVVAKYAKDMRDGRWGFSEAAIIIAADGGLLNGQHRLHAIVESGCAQTFVVVRGAPVGCIIDMDQGAKRSTRDAIALSGAVPGKIQHFDVACVTMLLSNGPVPPRSITHHDVAAALTTFWPSVEFTTRCAGARTIKHITTAPVFTPVLRAHIIGHKEDRLMEFGAVMTSGESNGVKDRAAIRLRNWLLMHAGVGGGGSMRKDIYARTESSLAYFLQNKSVSRLYGAAEELFPINAEERAALSGSGYSADMRSALAK